LIAGNHDFYPEKNLRVFEDECETRGITYLQDSSITLDGIKFYGTPWVPKFFDWAFMDYDHNLEHTFSKIPTDTDVLITHGPPFGILDKVREGFSVGSKSLRNKIETLKNLKVHAFGHIHEASGAYQEAGVAYINAAILDRNYKLTALPIELEVTK
jgi:Icc-related predicted phosphoesterase